MSNGELNKIALAGAGGIGLTAIATGALGAIVGLGLAASEAKDYHTAVANGNIAAAEQYDAARHTDAIGGAAMLLVSCAGLALTGAAAYGRREAALAHTTDLNSIDPLLDPRVEPAYELPVWPQYVPQPVYAPAVPTYHQPAPVYPRDVFVHGMPVPGYSRQVVHSRYRNMK